MSFFKNICWLLICCSTIAVKAQNYHALNGSSNAGVMGIYNNPASGVNMHSKWDLNLFSVQLAVNNSIIEQKNPAVFNFDTASFRLRDGYFKRYLNNVTNFELANFRYKINDDNCIAFGLRGRAYSNIRTSTIDYNAAMKKANDFINANPFNDLSFSLNHALWAELFVNYSKVLLNNDFKRISGGITISACKNISGAYVQGSKMSFKKVPEIFNINGYYLTAADFTGIYSSNYDVVNDANYNQKSTVDSFFQNNMFSPALSLGFEYIIKNQTAFYSSPFEQAQGYSWKFGFSILDIGNSIFKPAKGSFHVSETRLNTTNINIESQFNNYDGLNKFRDSLSGYFKNIDSLKNNFNIALPTRLLLSIDKNLGSNFYINAHSSINLNGTKINSRMKVRDMNFLTITPRWETRQWGVYLPMQYNAEGQVWIGAALKAGPLLLGVHRVGLIAGRMNNINTGGYLAFHFTPSKPKAGKTWYDCP